MDIEDLDPDIAALLTTIISPTLSSGSIEPETTIENE